MSRRKYGVIPEPILRHAKKHANLYKYLQQGTRRAVQRSAKAAQDTKARAVVSHYNMTGTEFRGINAIKRRFRTRFGNRGRLVEAHELLVAPAGIPLLHYGAKKVRGGISFSIVRGKRHLLRAGFSHSTFAGGHIFRRARTSSGRLVGRLPIDKRFGPGLPYLVQNRDVAHKGRVTYRQRLTEELRKEEERAYRRAKLK